MLAAVLWPQPATAQVNADGYLAADSGSTRVPDVQLRSLLQSKVPDVPTLIVFTQCWGGNCVDKFASRTQTTVLSATWPGQLSIPGTYDPGAAFGLRASPPSRTAQDTHNDGLMTLANAGAAGAGMTPMTGGGLAPSGFALLGVDPTAQARVSIVFYAGGADNNDLQRLLTIREFYPNARYYVLGSETLANDPARIGPAGYTELAAAIDAVANPVILGETVIIWVGGHGGYIRRAGSDADPQDVLQNPAMFPTDAIPQSVGDAINDQPYPHPRIVLEIPAQQANLVLPTSGPALFPPGSWSVSVPLTVGSYVSATFTEERFDGGDGIVGDDPEDVVQLGFVLPASSFTNAFVARTNVVTVVNTSGQSRPVRLLLDSGPISGNPGQACPADFNQSGAVSVQDIFDFLAAYFGNDPDADFNASGAVSVQDIFDFLTAYFTGCP